MKLGERTPPSESLSKEFCRLRNFRVDHLRNYYVAISDLWYGRPIPWPVSKLSQLETY